MAPPQVPVGAEFVALRILYVPLVQEFPEVKVIAEEQLSLLGCANKISGAIKKMKAVIINRI